MLAAKMRSRASPRPAAQKRNTRALYVGLSICAIAGLVYLVSPERRALGAVKDAPPLKFKGIPHGEASSVDYALYLSPAHEEAVLSYWHDIELPIQQLDSKHIVPMVVEIPKGTKAKMEINKERPWNPIAQDVKDGKLRYYPTPSVLHYGAIPRTYEHPKEQDDLTTLVGDGDPVDIVDVSDLPTEPGQVYWVRILGALAMEDDNAADWKIVAIRLTDPRAKYISDLSEIMDVRHVSLARGSDADASHDERSVSAVKKGDHFEDKSVAGAAATQADESPAPAVPAAAKASGPRAQVRKRTAPQGTEQRKGLRRIVSQLAELKTFLRDYKKKRADEPDPVTFAYEGSYLDAATAVDVVRHHHIHWCRLVDEAAAGKRVGSLSDAFHGYQYACDDARKQWAVELEGDETLGAGAGAAEPDAETKGLWLPIELDAANLAP